MLRGQDKKIETTRRFSEEQEPGTVTVDRDSEWTAYSQQLPAVGERLSVIIPTKDRAEDLRTAVASLLRQTRLPDELVIVDQSKTDETGEAIRRLLASAPSRLRSRVEVLHIRDSSITGGAQARNRGIELAHGNVWLFLDDDVELEPDFVRELLAAYERNPKAAGISGIVTNYRPAALSFRAWTAIFLRGPFRDDRQPVYLRANALFDAEPIRVTRFGGGLMSFRSAAVGRVRFDEGLTGVCDGEDVDFCMHLGPHPQLLIAPRARLVHLQSPSGRARDHWLRRFSQANSYLYHRNWRHGVANRISFLWLNTGLALVATAASLRRLSLVPWVALLKGVRAGRRSAIDS